MVPPLSCDVRRGRLWRPALTLVQNSPRTSRTPHDTLPLYPARGEPRRAWWRLREPSTAVTDLAITVVAIVFGVRLVQTGIVAAQWMGAGMVATAAAAAGGAAVHGIPHVLGESGWRMVWRLTLQLAIAANAALLVSVGVHALSGPALTLWIVASAIKLSIFAAASWRRYEFRLVVLDSIVTLAAVGVLQVALLAARDEAAPLVLAGVLVSVIAGVVQRAGVSLHRHFNHNDLYHLVQIVALYLFHRGGLLFAAG